MTHEMDQIRQQRTRNPSGMTESMTRLHQQLEDNLKKKTDEIMRVKSQKKDLELKLEGFKSKSRRLTQLTTEIEGMKQQVVALKRSAQQTQRQHKQELEEKKMEIQQLQRQSRQQTKQIVDLKRNYLKNDSLLRAQAEQNAQLLKQVKDLKASADVQRREHERYSKEEKKQIIWLEKQLKLQGHKDQQILQLEKRIKQKDQTILRIRELMKQQEARNRRKVQYHDAKNGDGDAIDKYEDEELADSMAQANAVLEENKSGVEELEMILKDNSFSEEKVLAHLRGLEVDEAHAMLCLMYKKLADYSQKIREVEALVGDKEERVNEMTREKLMLERKLGVQKSQYERVIKQIRDEYEAKLLEIQHGKDVKDAVVEAKERITRLYYKLKEYYIQLLSDYDRMKEHRDRYRLLYNLLKAKEKDRMNGRDEGERAAGGEIKTINGTTIVGEGETCEA